ncbi:hypothetical protein GQR60_01760 [Labilibaculum sp. A4]|uniref:hypothetical protein n=1 Tax=Labilibaculum euxinus TaxID=2686357 RepID=UPI000F622188|nr:hypothetical protein [Labilibaculum euxinus]MDQ1769536.1 hypothetical protein [Labilibaculum euxinus]MWN75061.1 hypothetical protein [Labilibaculum euxinus]
MSTIKNLINIHLSAERVESVNTALATLETALATKMSNLSGDERRKYGSISEQNKLFVNKVNNYAMNQTALRSPDVDWDEFAKDFNSRTVLEGTISRLQNLLTGINNAKTLHDYDNYQAALDDYAYTNYKTGTSAPGYEAKRNELKQFFSRIKKVDEKETADKK